jgi:hypothetical protein
MQNLDLGFHQTRTLSISLGILWCTRTPGFFGGTPLGYKHSEDVWDSMLDTYELRHVTCCPYDLQYHCTIWTMF